MLGEHTVPCGPCILFTFLVPATVSQVFHVSLLGSWSQAVTPLASVNHPGSQEDVISNCSQFGERCGLWVWDCSGPLPSTSGYCTPASLPLGREGPKWQPASSPLVFDRSQDFVLWTRQWSPTGIRAFCGRGPSIYFFVSLAIPQFGLLCHISALRLSSGHSSPVPTIRTNDAAHACVSNPHLLLVVATVWAAYLLVVAVGCVLCCFFFFPVMLLSEIPKLPTDSPVGGFPIVWKLLLHDTLPRVGLHP